MSASSVHYKQKGKNKIKGGKEKYNQDDFDEEWESVYFL